MQYLKSHVASGCVDRWRSCCGWDEAVSNLLGRPSCPYQAEREGDPRERPLWGKGESPAEDEMAFHDIQFIPPIGRFPIDGIEMEM